eukprot:40006_1
MGQCQCNCQCNRAYGHELGDESDTEDELMYETDVIDVIGELNELNCLGEMSPKSLTRFMLKLYLQRLPDDLKTVCMRYLGEDSKVINNLDLQYPFNSTILNTKEKYSLLAIFQRHLKARSITFKLIYRASQDGYTAHNFHTKCDKYDYTVFIVEPLSNTQTTKLPVFGAFTSIKLTNIEKEHRDSNMLMFRVRADYRSKPLMEPNVYHSENSFQYHRHNYVKTYTHSVIGFGCIDNTYLFIDDKFHWRNNYVANDHLTKWRDHTIGYTVKDKEKLYFRIKEMEVFQIQSLVHV